MARGVYDRTKSKPRPKHTEETKNKMRESHKGNKNVMYGIHRYGKDSPMFGKKHSIETKEKMSENAKKRFSNPKNNPMYGVHRYGEKSPCWKGGRKKHSDGYICVYKPEHPFCNIRKYIFEHRLVMEKKLGRYLKPEEIVHHINRVRNDNRIENLLLFDNNIDHIKYHRAFLACL